LVGKFFTNFVLHTTIGINKKKFVEVTVMTPEYKRFYLHEITLAEDIVAATIQDPYRRVKQPQPVQPAGLILVQMDLVRNKEQAEVRKTGIKMP